MTTYVVTVPGTFTDGIGSAAKAELTRALRPADPHATQLGNTEDLDVLAVNDDNTFTLHMRIEADSRADAEQDARSLADSALRDAGLDENSAPLGPVIITGIDSDI